MAVGRGQGGGLEAEVRKVKVIDSDRAEGHRFEERNFADIVYEYSVAGRKLRNNRVSIGEDRGNFEVAETIAKYPVGAVVTVYYNPLHPDQAVLERDLPKGMWGCLGIGTAIVLAIVFGSAIGLHQITEFVIDADSASRKCRRWPSPSARSAPSWRCSRWRCTGRRRWRRNGRSCRAPSSCPTSSSTVPRRRTDGSRGQIMYQRRVSYTYKYNNLTYTNTHATLASSVASTSSWLVRKSTTDYQDGATVKVWVNPDNPSQATLEPRAGFVWVLWLSPRRSGAWRITLRRSHG